MIILVVSQKGGCGKSTLATNICAFLAQNHDVLLVDADRQPTSSEWLAERRQRKGLPKVTGVQKYGEIDDTLIEFNTKYEYVVVDCAGKDSSEMRSAMLVADIAITPVRPSQADLNTLDVLCNVIIKQALRINQSMKSLIVLTMAPTNPQINEIHDAKSFIEDYPILKLCNQIIYDRKVYRDCLSEGMGVTEFTNEKASDEMNSLMEEVLHGN